MRECCLDCDGRLRHIALPHRLALELYVLGVPPSRHSARAAASNAFARFGIERLRRESVCRVPPMALRSTQRLSVRLSADHRFGFTAQRAGLFAARISPRARQFARTHTHLVQRGESQPFDDTIIANRGWRQPVNEGFDAIHHAWRPSRRGLIHNTPGKSSEPRVRSLASGHPAIKRGPSGRRALRGQMQACREADFSFRSAPLSPAAAGRLGASRLLRDGEPAPRSGRPPHRLAVCARSHISGTRAFRRR